MGSGSGGGGAYGALSGGGGGEGDGEGGWDRDRRGGAGCERCWRQRLCCRRLEATWQPRASAIVFAVVLIVCRLFDVLAMFGDCAAVGLLYLPLIFRANPAHNLTCSPSYIIMFKVLDLVAWSVLYPVAVLLALKQNSNAWRSLGRAAIRDIARARSVAAGAHAPPAHSAVHTSASAGALALQQQTRAASLSRPIVTCTAQGRPPRPKRGARFAPLLRRLGFDARDGGGNGGWTFRANNV